MQSLLEWIIVALRWAHIVAILGWVGASLFFMWLESKLRRPEPGRKNVLGEAWMGHGGGFYIVEKRHITAGQVPSPVYWFRVEAGITWITGFLLLVFVYYWSGGVDLVDAETSALSPQMAIGFALALLVFAWIVYDRLWASNFAEEHPLTANIVSLTLLAAVVYVLCDVFTGRAAFIHVGAVLGTNMVANVWTRIIPAQEEAVAATAAGRERSAVMAARAKRRATHNTYMTLPVIFAMIAPHVPSAYSHSLNWLIMVLLIFVGMAARHMMIMFDRRRTAPWAWVSAGAPLVVAVAVLGFLTAPASVSAPSREVPFTVVRGIVDLRCASCHSRTPTDMALAAGAAGMSFGKAEEIVSRAELIKASVLNRTMPLGNKTGMTDEERALIGRWVDQGARID